MASRNDPQRKKAVQDLNAKKKQEELGAEKILVSSPTSLAGTEMNRAQFNETQRDKQLQQIKSQQDKIKEIQELKEGGEGILNKPIEETLNPPKTGFKDIGLQSGQTSSIIGGTENTFAGTAQKAATFIDIIRSGITGKKPLPVQKAETSFSDASNTISQGIELVKTGQKNISELERDFEQAVGAINRLEAEAKLKGKLNLRFWIDEGKELETSIINEKAILENKRIELLNARINFLHND